MCIYNREGALDIRQSLHTRRVKEAMQLLLDKYKDIKIAERRAKCLTEALHADCRID